MSARTPILSQNTVRCVGFAFLLAVLFAGVALMNLINYSRAERVEVAAIAHAFEDIYVAVQQEGMPVPARFRRLALEAYAQGNQERFGHLAVTMPGMPGEALHTETHDPDVIAAFQQYEQTGRMTPITQSRFMDGRFIDRTILPSVATDESCAECHNRHSETRVWESGDIMGAFVLESDLTAGLNSILGHSGIVFLCAFLGLSVLVAVDQRRVRQLEAEIEARRRQEEEEVRHMALHDPLTGIGNRAYFSDKVEELAGQDRAFHLFLFDLDRFKRLNDDHGHAAGDAVLVHVAKAISKVMTPLGGSCARLGGDEFAAILPCRAMLPDVLRIAQNLQEEIAKPVRCAGKVLIVECSVGVAPSDYAGLDTFEDLNRAADAALYEAKRDDSINVALYGEELHQRLQSRRKMAKAVPLALENSEFEVHYQPQVDLTTGQLRGFEALLRWEHEGRQVPPADLIPILEENGLICKSDTWVLEQTLRQLSDWDARGFAQMNGSVNLSPLNFRTNRVVENVALALAASDVAPERITLEITETILLQNWDEVTDIIAQLKTLGVQMALDDFGTGYSSLDYLRRLAVDEIKIDRAFLTDIETHEETRFLFDGIAEMAVGLGRRLVVEGVETAQQRDLVARRNGHVAQGFFFGRPMPAAEAEVLIPRREGFPDRRKA